MSRFEAVPGKAILHGSDGFGREVLGDDPHRRTRPTEKNARTRHANAERVSKARHILVGGGSEGCVEPMKMRNHDVEHELLRKPPLRRRVPFRLGGGRPQAPEPGGLKILAAALVNRGELEKALLVEAQLEQAIGHNQPCQHGSRARAKPHTHGHRTVNLKVGPGPLDSFQLQR